MYVLLDCNGLTNSPVEIRTAICIQLRPGIAPIPFVPRQSGVGQRELQFFIVPDLPEPQDSCGKGRGRASRVVVYRNKPRYKIEQLTYGEIMVLSVFRVEHAIVVVEIYAIVFPLCKHISTPKSNRKGH